MEAKSFDCEDVGAGEVVGAARTGAGVGAGAGAGSEAGSEGLQCKSDDTRQQGILIREEARDRDRDGVKDSHGKTQ